MTLTEFLLSCIAEDEALLLTVEDPAPMPADPEIPPWLTGRILMHPSRMLAECGAKRRIVERCAGCIEDEADWDAAPMTESPEFYSGVSNRADDARATLQDLAVVYADRPDYAEVARP